MPLPLMLVPAAPTQPAIGGLLNLEGHTVRHSELDERIEAAPLWRVVVHLPTVLEDLEVVFGFLVSLRALVAVIMRPLPWKDEGLGNLAAGLPREILENLIRLHNRKLAVRPYLHPDAVRLRAALAHRNLLRRPLPHGVFAAVQPRDKVFGSMRPRGPRVSRQRRDDQRGRGGGGSETAAPRGSAGRYRRGDLCDAPRRGHQQRLHARDKRRRRLQPRGGKSERSCS
mmetsp:Transcript_110572/g.311876  ORF Transcript_110572/g.311876 Transcript_110572/m.311876 type:complete len:227 (-) Transcript_110572:131-811(-)